jgi:hypothetical protein
MVFVIFVEHSIGFSAECDSRNTNGNRAIEEEGDSSVRNRFAPATLSDIIQNTTSMYRMMIPTDDRLGEKRAVRWTRGEIGGWRIATGWLRNPLQVVRTRAM